MARKKTHRKSKTTAPSLPETLRALLADETGGVVKPWGSVWPMALCYANTYHVGMSSLGYQAIWGRLNIREDIAAERVFWDVHHPESFHGRHRRPAADNRLMDFAGPADPDQLPPEGNWPAYEPLSVENQRPLSQFPVIAFSLAFEMDYLHMIDMLARAGLDPWAARRGPDDPLVVAGGKAVTMNRLPIYDFVDVVIHGDGEEAVDILAQALNNTGPGRDHLREALRGLPGFEVTEPRHPDEEAADVGFEDPAVERLALATRLGEFHTHSRILTPHTEFSNRLLVEISRGCPYVCNFCIMGYETYKYQRRTPEQIEAVARAYREQTRRIGLVASAVGVHREIEEVCERLMRLDMDISFSSLRVEDVKPIMVDALLHSGQKTLTIAPEAGNEKLRYHMRKRLPDAKVLDFVSDTVARGMPNVKLYFMIGVMDETEEDVVSIARFTEKLHRVQVEAARRHGRIGRLAINVGVFVPKPGTPQFHGGFVGVREARRRLKLLQGELKRIPNIKVHFSNPHLAAAQTILSCGGRRAADFLWHAWRHHRGDWRSATREYSGYLEMVAPRRSTAEVP